LPLHTLVFTTSKGHARCLLDDFSVTFSPSSSTRAACSERRAMRANNPTRMLVAANPMPHSSPLPGTQLEADLISEMIPPDALTLLTKQEATKGNVLTHIGDATHIHLACHGSASIFGEPMSAALSLAH